MDTPTVLAIVFGVVGVVSLILAYRWRPRRSVLFITTDEQALDIPSSAGLTVSFGAERIAHPLILTARLRNLGPNDITPGTLDGGYMRLLTMPGAVLSATATNAQVEITRAPDSARGAVAMNGKLKAEMDVKLGNSVGAERQGKRAAFLATVPDKVLAGVMGSAPDRIDITPDIVAAGEVITITAVAKEPTHADPSAKVAGFTTRTPNNMARSNRLVGLAGIAAGQLGIGMALVLLFFEAGEPTGNSRVAMAAIIALSSLTLILASGLLIRVNSKQRTISQT